MAGLHMIALFLAIEAICCLSLGVGDFGTGLPRYPEDRQCNGHSEGVGEALYLTPYIESGDIAAAKSLAEVPKILDGLEEAQQPDSYSGFITVNKTLESNMFFWFFLATDIDHKTAPLVLWLDGGPGISSMFGLLELNGPFQAVFEENGNVTGVPNPYAWTKVANVIYVDNPVGAGYSHSTKLHTNIADITTDLYEFLTQWFKLFSEYQGNDFFVFGVSFAGKYVAAISRRIDEENSCKNSEKMHINLKGLGIANGFMSPPDSAVYGEFLFNVGLVGEVEYKTMLQMEEQMKSFAAEGHWFPALGVLLQEFNYIAEKMECPYRSDITTCEHQEEEVNFELYMQLIRTRKAVHVGNLTFSSQFGAQYEAVRMALGNYIMRSERPTIEYLLERYPVLIFNGNLDVTCNHFGITKMFAAMTSWSGRDKYYETEREAFIVNGETAGYMKIVDNLNLFVMRNAGHFVPRSQPEYALALFEQFIKRN